MNPDEVMTTALDVLDDCLALTEQAGPETHTAISATDLENPEVPKALGRYVMGVLLGAVDEDASLSKELLDTDINYAEEVRGHVQRKIGSSNDFDGPGGAHFRDHVRNPYLVEILAHALLILRKRRDTACLLGPTAALKQPHPDPRRQGIDLVAIYDEAGTAIPVLGEAKASNEYGRNQLRSAAEFFSSVDAGKRGVEIRAELSALKHVLPANLRAGFGANVWRERCCYLPVVVHGDSLDILVDHGELGALRPAQAYVRLIGLSIKGFHDFFDRVADGVRESQEELLG
jgi:hypothetical protein